METRNSKTFQFSNSRSQDTYQIQRISGKETDTVPMQDTNIQPKAKTSKLSDSSTLYEDLPTSNI